MYLKTPAAAKKLNTTYHRLMGLIRFCKIQRPERDSSGDYVWTAQDLSRAKRALDVGRQQGSASKPASV